MRWGPRAQAARPRRRGPGSGGVRQDPVPPALATILAALAQADPVAITRSQRLAADLGLDSLLMIDVACAAEDAFGIRIPDEDLERFVTVGDAADYIERARSAG